MSLINREDLMQTLGITDMDCEKCGWYSRTARRCKRGSDFEDACCAIDDALEVEPEQRWIPCSERMPEYDKPVLLSTAWCNTEIGFWTQRGWMIVACSYREFEQSAVTAWMPLPEPYAERRQQ